MARSRRGFSKWVNPSAVNPVTDQNPSLAEVARKLGINVEVLRRWTASTQAKGKEAVPEKIIFRPWIPRTRSTNGCWPNMPACKWNATFYERPMNFANLPK